MNNQTVDVLKEIKNALKTGQTDSLFLANSESEEINDARHEIGQLLFEKKIAYDSLNLQQDKINYVLSNMAEGFTLIDKNKHILLCNQSVKTFFSCDHDLIGLPLADLVKDKTLLHAVDKALEKEQSSTFELWLHEDLILNAYVSPTQKSPATSREPAATVFFVNVTTEKQLEKQKRVFFSNASHELKTPITSILGFSEMINRKIITTEPEKEEVLQRIEIEARRMTDLINNLLMISNLESKTKLIEYTDFNLNDVLQEAVASVSPINNNTHVKIDLTSSDVVVYANRRQLYELAVNLIENAVKYNKPDGKVTIELKARKYYVTLKVKDTGIGIPPEFQARVFERFFRVDYGRDKKVGGSGLGLSIVKHIVNLYSGEISVRSKKDVGTTIQVRLPIVRRQDK